MANAVGGGKREDSRSGDCMAKVAFKGGGRPDRRNSASGRMAATGPTLGIFRLNHVNGELKKFSSAPSLKNNSEKSKTYWQSPKKARILKMSDNGNGL